MAPMGARNGKPRNNDRNQMIYGSGEKNGREEAEYSPEIHERLDREKQGIHHPLPGNL